MVRIAKKKDLNVHIENVYSEYYYTYTYGYLTNPEELKHKRKDVFVWRNGNTNQLIGSREIFRIGNNYVNLCLN